MVASAVFITDLSGKAIISRDYRGDVVPLTKAIDRFARYLRDTPDEQKKPVFFVDAADDAMVEEDVGATGPAGETYVYIAVSLVNLFLLPFELSCGSNSASQSLILSARLSH